MVHRVSPWFIVVIWLSFTIMDRRSPSWFIGHHHGCRSPSWIVVHHHGSSFTVMVVVHHHGLSVTTMVVVHQHGLSVTTMVVVHQHGLFTIMDRISPSWFVGSRRGSPCVIVVHLSPPWFQIFAISGAIRDHRDAKSSSGRVRS